jgi:exopolyphosphatase/pppGpp-phosphohydrolase
LGFPPPWNGARFSTDALPDVLTALASMEQAQRAALPAIGDRADIIVAGVVVLLEALRHLGAAECVVLEHGVRAGALLAMADDEL